MSSFKQIIFLGNSLEDLRAFPDDLRREAGYQIDVLQRGGTPADFKPVSVVGSGVHEIRLRDCSGQFRVLYVAKFAEAIYILHCFPKKTQKISKRDLDLATQRYRELLKERKHEQ